MHALQRQLSGSEASTSGRFASYCHVPSLSRRLISYCQATAPSSSRSTSPAPKQQQQQQQPQQQQQRQRQQAVKTQPLKLPPSEFAKIKKAAYISSSGDLKGCPPQSQPEFAVIGRSNVGKSSLINMLTQSNKLAKVSKQPGMTKTINHFLINDSWYLVDLPGYGYAKTAGKDARTSWLDFTKQYFLKRRVLVAVMLLVDASIPPQQMDLECANWLAEALVPFCIVFTKCDPRKKSGPTPAANMKAWKTEWLQQYEELPACFETSAQLGQGRSEVLNYLASLRVLDEEQGEEL